MMVNKVTALLQVAEDKTAKLFVSSDFQLLASILPDFSSQLRIFSPCKACCASHFRSTVRTCRPIFSLKHIECMRLSCSRYYVIACAIRNLLYAEQPNGIFMPFGQHFHLHYSASRLMCAGHSSWYGPLH